MSLVKKRELARMYKGLGAAKMQAHLQEALDNKELKPEDFSIRDIAEATLGHEFVDACDPRNSGSAMQMLEAGDGVDSTAFSNITGQLVYSKIMEAYNQEAFVMSGIVPNIPTRLSGERIPGIGKIVDETPTVQEGMSYENFGFGEDYIDTPATTKRGFIVPVTKEAIFFDRTGLVLQRAAEVGEVLGLNKEKRLLDLVLGVTNNYKWKGTSHNTYQEAAPWINQLDEELIDWTDVDAAEQLFADILDPNTGEPVLVSGATLLTMPAYSHAANRIINATEIRYTDTSAKTQTIAANPLRGYTAITSRLAYRRLIASGATAADAKKYWFLGDFAKAFAYMENWPVTVTQAPSNSEAEFTQDIVARYKASERGVAAVMNPRYVIKSTGGTDD